VQRKFIFREQGCIVEIKDESMCVGCGIAMERRAIWGGKKAVKDHQSKQNTPLGDAWVDMLGEADSAATKGKGRSHQWIEWPLLAHFTAFDGLRIVRGGGCSACCNLCSPGPKAGKRRR
jgi:hypothetical protein